MDSHFDSNNVGSLRNLLEHIPLLGMVVATRGGMKVELWHLIVAMIGLAVVLGTTFGTVVWNQATRQAELAEKVNQNKRDNDALAATTAYIRRRQEINEDVIKQLQVEAALNKEANDRMIREHADIYQAIRGMKR